MGLTWNLPDAPEGQHDWKQVPEGESGRVKNPEDQGQVHRAWWPLVMLTPRFLFGARG